MRVSPNRDKRDGEKLEACVNERHASLYFIKWIIAWVPSATISRPTWAPWKMQSVVFLPEKMLPSPHKPEFQSRTRAPPCCQRVETSINNLYFRCRIHHASRYFSNLDLFFRLPGNSLSDFILWITLTGNTYHSPAQRRLPTDQSRQPYTLYTSAHALENYNSHLSTQHGPTSPEPSTIFRPSAQ